MSKIIPPMISSSPPPMDDAMEDDDDDDEFGSFSTANFSYNLDITQPSKLSTDDEWKATAKHQYDFDAIRVVEGTKDTTTYNDVSHRNGTHSNIEILPEGFLTEEDEEVSEAFPREIKEVSSIPEMQQDNTSQDSVVSVATDSGLCSASQDSEGPSPLPIGTGFVVSLPASDDVSQDGSSSSDETLVKSSDADYGHFTSSAEKAGDETSDNILSRNVHILGGLNSVESCFQDSLEVSKKESDDQFSTSINQELKSTSTIDDFCDFSDFQTVKGNAIISGSDVSDHGSPVNSVKVNVNKLTVDHLPNNAYSVKVEKVLTNNALNMVRLGCEGNVPEESRGHLSGDVHLNKRSDSSNTAECDYTRNTTEKVSSSQISVSGDLQIRDDDFEDFAVPSLSVSSFTKPDDTFDPNDGFADFASCEVRSVTVAPCAPVHKLDESGASDDEFADFASCEDQLPSDATSTSTPVIKYSHSDGLDDDFADFASSEMVPLPLGFSVPEHRADDSDDEFSNFACGSVASFSSVAAKEDRGWVNESAIKLPTVSKDLNQTDDDFDDFETASFSSTAVPTIADHSQLSSRLENVVTTLFPGPGVIPTEMSDAVVPLSGRMVERNPVWSDLRDVDTSHALSYQWNNSSANKMLLSALGIDTRNILFGAKWNVAVPRFAANLGVSPLEPVPAHSAPVLQPTRELVPKPSSTHTEASTSSGAEATVPDAQFDWTSSGLVNPLDCEEKNGRHSTTSSHRSVNNGQQLLTSSGVGGRLGLSAEAVKVLESLPNLSFLRTKVLMFPSPGQALTH